MSELSLLAVSLLTQTQIPALVPDAPPIPSSDSPPISHLTNRCATGLSLQPTSAPCPPAVPEFSLGRSLKLLSSLDKAPLDQALDRSTASTSEFLKAIAPAPQWLNAWSQTLATNTPPPTETISLPRPSSGSQMYAQRMAALQHGRTYTRLPVDSYYETWQTASYQPTYEEWKQLLAREAQSMARGQGNNRLTVMVGDSLSLWYPNDRLSSDRFWLNQGISGDTSQGVLSRLSYFSDTHPDLIHVMVGINDLRRGVEDQVLLGNLRQIMQQLRQQHPNAEIIVHSILPTRLPALPSDRIQSLNASIEAIAHQEQVSYFDLQAYFVDETGLLARDLTTDGIHLSNQGYAVWQLALRQFHLAYAGSRIG